MLIVMHPNVARMRATPMQWRQPTAVLVCRRGWWSDIRCWTSFSGNIGSLASGLTGQNAIAVLGERRRDWAFGVRPRDIACRLDNTIWMRRARRLFRTETMIDARDGRGIAAGGLVLGARGGSHDGRKGKQSDWIPHRDKFGLGGACDSWHARRVPEAKLLYKTPLWPDRKRFQSWHRRICWTVPPRWSLFLASCKALQGQASLASAVLHGEGLQAPPGVACRFPRDYLHRGGGVASDLQAKYTAYRTLQE